MTKNTNKSKKWRRKMTKYMIRNNVLAPTVYVNENEKEPEFDGAGFTSDNWDNTNDDLKIVTTCGRKPEGPLTILFSRVAKNKVDLLMKKFTNIEWLAYLIGDKDSRFVEDIVLPLQEVSAGAVHVTGPQPSEKVIGVIHSHHNMGAFFSGTDDAYINANYDISVVIAHSGMKSQVRWITPCGYKVVSDGEVKVQKEDLFNEDEFLKGVDQVVTKYSTRVIVNPIKPNFATYNIDDIDEKNKNLYRSIGAFASPANPKFTKGFAVKGLSIGTKDPLEDEDELKDTLTTNFRNSL